jgi:hypothetical protein
MPMRWQLASQKGRGECDTEYTWVLCADYNLIEIPTLNSYPLQMGRKRTTYHEGLFSVDVREYSNVILSPKSDGRITV